MGTSDWCALLELKMDFQMGIKNTTKRKKIISNWQSLIWLSGMSDSGMKILYNRTGLVFLCVQTAYILF
jgi:hypothetical protein